MPCPTLLCISFYLLCLILPCVCFDLPYPALCLLCHALPCVYAATPCSDMPRHALLFLFLIYNILLYTTLCLPFSVYLALAPSSLPCFVSILICCSLPCRTSALICLGQPSVYPVSAMPASPYPIPTFPALPILDLLLSILCLFILRLGARVCPKAMRIMKWFDI